MDKILLHGLPILLFCAVAQGLWCFHHCRGSNPCVPSSCYACGEDQCYHQELINGSSKEEVQTEELLKNVKKDNVMHWPFGCTTAKNRHLCNTTQYVGVMPFFVRNLTIYAKIDCCNTFRCNDPKGTPPF